MIAYEIYLTTLEASFIYLHQNFNAANE